MDKDLIKSILKKANEDAEPYGVKWHLLAYDDKHAVFCMGGETQLRQIKEIIVVNEMDMLISVLEHMENLARKCYNDL